MDISNATYGRSSKGIDSLIKGLKNDLRAFNNEVVDVKYSRIVSAVRNNWSGADADAFLKKLKASYDKYIAAVNKISKQLDTIFADELKRFKAQQGKINI